MSQSQIPAEIQVELAKFQKAASEATALNGVIQNVDAFDNDMVNHIPFFHYSQLTCIDLYS